VRIEMGVKSSGMGILFLTEIPGCTFNNRHCRKRRAMTLDDLCDDADDYIHSRVGYSLGIIMQPARPWVCLWRCALWLSGLVCRAKSCTSVFLAGKVLFLRSDSFAVGCMYRLATKRTAETSRRKREREFFETQKTTRVLVCSELLTVENLRRSISQTLLVMLEWIEFGCVNKLIPRRIGLRISRSKAWCM